MTLVSSDRRSTFLLLKIGELKVLCVICDTELEHDLAYEVHLAEVIPCSCREIFRERLRVCPEAIAPWHLSTPEADVAALSTRSRLVETF